MQSNDLPALAHCEGCLEQSAPGVGFGQESRVRGFPFAAVLLAGCDGAREPVVEPAAVVDPDRVEAEKARAALTGYRPGGSNEMLAEEFKACVGAVAEQGAPELRGRSDDPA